MTGVMVMQGRELRAEDIGLIQALLAEHPDVLVASSDAEHHQSDEKRVGAISDPYTLPDSTEGRALVFEAFPRADHQ